MRSILQDVISVASSQGIIIAFGLFRAIIIARMLGPEANGILTTLLVYPTLFMTIGALGVRKSSAYYIGTKEYAEKDIITGVIQIWMITSLLGVIISYGLIAYLSNASSEVELIILAILPLPFSLLVTYLSGVFLGRNDIKYFNKINWIPAVLISLATFVLIFVFDLTIRGALLAELVGPLVLCIILITKLKLWSYLSFTINKVLLAALFKLGLGFALSLVVINMNYRIDIIIMDQLSTKYEIGIYSKGSVLTQYLWQIPALLGTIVFARGTNTKDRLLYSKKVAKLLRVSLIIIALGSLLLFSVSDLIIQLLFGEAFQASSAIMIWLLPGVVLLTIFKVLNMDIGSKGKPLFALKSMIPALIINIVLNYMLIPQYGAVGAAGSSTVSYSIGGILFLYFYSKETSLSIKEIFRFRLSDFDFLNPYFNKIGIHIK